MVPKEVLQSDMHLSVLVFIYWCMLGLM